MTDVAASTQPWYRSLNRNQWNILIASNLGWLFDGYETYALVISIGVALRQLLDPSQYPQIPVYAGTVIALTLLGWAIGGMIGGIIADYIGRKRTMILAILAYSIMTGLSALAWDWTSLAVLRFLVGVAIGSEWVTGTSIVSELWPDKNRGKGVGLMQCGFGIGFFLASFAWLFVSPMGPGAWRVMFVLGVLPALLTLWIRRAIPESDRWERVNERRAAATERKRSGAELTGQEQALARFTVADLFADPKIRRNLILAFLSVPILFVWTHDLSLMLVAAAFSGIFVSGQYTWMAAWLPELFPTRVRATATAFVFNTPRLIAWTGPLISGWIIANLGGFGQAAVAIATVYIISLAAAPFLPETRGKPLPE